MTPVNNQSAESSYYPVLSVLHDTARAIPISLYGLSIAQFIEALSRSSLHRFALVEQVSIVQFPTSAVYAGTRRRFGL